MSVELALALLIGLSVGWVALGLYLGRNAKELESFALCDRNVGLALGSATAVATWITSNTTLLAPQFAIQLGVWGMIAYSAASFGLFLFAPLAKRIRRLMPEGFTSGDFIRARYGRVSWALFMGISLFYAITWLISMGMAGGLLLKAVAGIPYLVGMSAILLTCVLYTLFGGMRAVVGTDYIQSVVILIGVVSLGYLVWDRFSLDAIHRNVSESRPALLWMMFPAAIMAVFNNLMFGLGEIFHSNIWWSRAFAIREGLGARCYGLAGLFWLPVPIAAGFIAFSADALGINILSADMVGPQVAVALLGKAGAVLIFVIVYCSLASSIDSLLAATSDLVANDLYKHLLRADATDPQIKRAMSVATLGLGLLAWVVCLFNQASLAAVLFFAGPLVGSIIWPILAGLYWEKASGITASLAMIFGSIVGLYFYFAIGWFVASLIGTIVSMVITILGSLLSQDKFDWHQLAASKEELT